MPKRIRLQSVKEAEAQALNPKKKANFVAAQVCYYYPKYSLSQARRLPYRDAMLLLQVAQHEQAKYLLQLVQIAAAPHTEKGRGVKKLTSTYQKVIKETNG